MLHIVEADIIPAAGGRMERKMFVVDADGGDDAAHRGRLAAQGHVQTHGGTVRAIVSVYPAPPQEPVEEPEAEPVHEPAALPEAEPEPAPPRAKRTA